MHSFLNNNKWLEFEKIISSISFSIEHIYTKYAAMMFGYILDIFKEQQIVSWIFKHVFLNLKDTHLSKACYVPLGMLVKKELQFPN